MDKENYNKRARGYYHKKKEIDPSFLERKNEQSKLNYSEKIKDENFKERKRKKDLEYYHQNKEIRVAKQIERRKELLEEAKKKLGGKCVCCGINENLEFDHIDDAKKVHNVANAVRNTREVFWDEVSKCQLLCVKCHSKKTTAQKRAKQKLWLSLSLQEREKLINMEMCQLENCPD
jgi:hypothetical protein